MQHCTSTHGHENREAFQPLLTNEVQDFVRKELRALKNAEGVPDKTGKTLFFYKHKVAPVFDQEDNITYGCNLCDLHFQSDQELGLHKICVHQDPPKPVNIRRKVIRCKTWFPPRADSLGIQPSLCCNPEPKKEKNLKPKQLKVPKPNSSKTNAPCNLVSSSHNDFFCNIRDTQNPTSIMVHKMDLQPVQSQSRDWSRKRRGGHNDEQVTSKRKRSKTNVLHSLAGSSHNAPKKEESSSYICRICGTQLPSCASLMVHIDSHFPSDATPANDIFVGDYCTVCKKTCRDQVEVNNHLFLHIPTFQPGLCCCICKKSFNADSNKLEQHFFENHILKKSSTRYYCRVCKGAYVSVPMVLTHLFRCHTYICQHYHCRTCPELTFHDQVIAQRHMLQHIPPPFNPSPINSVPCNSNPNLINAVFCNSNTLSVNPSPIYSVSCNSNPLPLNPPSKNTTNAIPKASLPFRKRFSALN